MKSRKLTICISTIDNRIENIKNILIEPLDSIRYIVIHQKTHENNSANELIENLKLRKDVSYFPLRTLGLTKSRNYALKQVENKEIVLLADDDVRYEKEHLLKVLYSFEQYEEDIITFKIKTPPGEEEFKKYCNYSKQITEPNDLKPTPSSIEIAFRGNKVKEKRINFDTRFGVGSFFPGGEENLFLRECLKNNLRIRYVPEYIVEHPYESTKSKFSRYGKEKGRYQGANNYMSMGLEGFFRTVLSPIKNRKKIKNEGGRELKYLFYCLQGYLYMVFTDLKQMKRTKLS